MVYGSSRVYVKIEIKKCKWYMGLLAWNLKLELRKTIRLTLVRSYIYINMGGNNNNNPFQRLLWLEIRKNLR